jgi:hypothetical protein
MPELHYVFCCAVELLLPTLSFGVARRIATNLSRRSFSRSIVLEMRGCGFGGIAYYKLVSLTNGRGRADYTAEAGEHCEYLYI